MTDFDSGELNKLTEKLLREYAVDFREYKPTTLSRRIQRRLDATHCSDIPCYLEYLDRHPNEYSKLIDTLLINVTQFFRDPEAWEVIRNDVLPVILSEKRPGDQVRIWSAGCATGEEPFTMAMVLAEAAGSKLNQLDVRIYATDIDEKALSSARRGEFSSEAIESIPEPLREKYLVRNSLWRFDRAIRKMLIFGRHNLVTDAPISRVDLIICRNVLIYMTVDLQNRILAKFHYALQPHGYLFLGRAESLLTASRVFESVHEKARVFRKASQVGEAAFGDVDQTAVLQATEVGGVEYQRLSLFNEAVLRYTPSAIIALDNDGNVRVINNAAETVWGTKPRDMLGKSVYQESLRPSLQSILPRIQEVRTQRSELRIEEMDLSAEQDKPFFVLVSISPMFDVRGKPLGVTIVAENVTSQVRLRNELEDSNEQLAATNEELETTNEELQSTNEELETTNEELQSTNEELETTNEELQSTNEELATTNDELTVRTADLDRLSLYFNSVIQSLDVPVVVLNEDHAVTTWNAAAERFYGIPAHEAFGRNFFDLRLPVRFSRTRDKLRGVRESRQVYRSRPVEYQTRTGETRKVIMEYQPLLDVQGRYRGAISVVRDADAQPLQAAAL